MHAIGLSSKRILFRNKRVMIFKAFSKDDRSFNNSFFSRKYVLHKIRTFFRSSFFSGKWKGVDPPNAFSHEEKSSRKKKTNNESYSIRLMRDKYL